MSQNFKIDVLLQEWRILLDETSESADSDVHFAVLSSYHSNLENTDFDQLRARLEIAREQLREACL